jgi:hypothetical protein
MGNGCGEGMTMVVAVVVCEDMMAEVMILRFFVVVFVVPVVRCTVFVEMGCLL